MVPSYLGTYGIGIFTPTILAASIGYKTKHAGNVADMISNDELAALGQALIDVLLIVGIACAVLLVNRFGRHSPASFGDLSAALPAFSPPPDPASPWGAARHS